MRRVEVFAVGALILQVMRFEFNSDMAVHGRGSSRAYTCTRPHPSSKRDASLSVILTTSLE